MATKMKMVMKGGKKVPAFAADGKGKMQMGGVKMKKYDTGGDTPGDPAPRLTGFEKRQAKKIARAKTNSEVAKIEGEGTVADMRNNRARRFSQAIGTVGRKVPKSVSTSTSNTDNRNSGNTSNTTSSGSNAGANAGADANSSSNSSSNINGQPRPGSGGRRPRERVSTTPVTPIQKRGGSTKATKPKMKVGGSTTKKMQSGGMYNPAMMPPMKKGGKVATKKYFTGGPTGANGDRVGSGSESSKQPKESKVYVQAKSIKKAKYGTAMMRKGGATKKK